MRAWLGRFLLYKKLIPIHSVRLSHCLCGVPVYPQLNNIVVSEDRGAIERGHKEVEKCGAFKE